MTDKASLVRKIKEKFGAKVEAWPEQDEIDQDTPMVQSNRRDKRRARQYSVNKGTSEVHDTLRRGHFRGRKKTGQPQWFRVMQFEGQRRKALEKVSLDRLEPAVGSIALDLCHAGYKNVWQLTQVEDVNELLRVGQQSDIAHGVRSKELKHLRNYLVQQRVPVKWEV